MVEKAKAGLEVVSIPRSISTALGFSRAWKLGADWGLYHVGMVGTLITGLLLLALGPVSQMCMWLHDAFIVVHGIFGALFILGCLGLAARFGGRILRTAPGALDTLFVLAICILGVIPTCDMLCSLLGASAPDFIAAWASKAAMLHAALVLAWIFLSYAYGGAARHAAWFLVAKPKQPKVYEVFTKSPVPEAATPAKHPLTSSVWAIKQLRDAGLLP